MAGCFSSKDSDASANFPSEVEAFTSLMKYVDWMGQLSDEKKAWPLKDLALPGTHDSGTFDLDLYGPVSDSESKTIRILAKIFVKTTKSIIYRWSVTQDFTFTDQLLMGVRYLDLRISTRSDKPGCYFVHGLFGRTVEEGLSQISKFLDQYPTEVVLLDFNHFYDMTPDDHAKLISLIKSKLSGKLCPYIGCSNATLNVLAKLERQAIVFYQNDAALPIDFWPSYAVPSPWPNTDEVDTLMKILTANYQTGRPKDTFYVTQGLLTPTRTTIFKHGCSSLRKVLSGPADLGMEDWLQNKIAGPAGLNIVIVDFIQYCNIIPVLMAKNGL